MDSKRSQHISEAREQRVLAPGLAGTTPPEVDRDRVSKCDQALSKLDLAVWRNPFDLPGPEFSDFLRGLGRARRSVYFGLRAELPKRHDAPRIDYSDPYSLAYLRGG